MGAFMYCEKCNAENPEDAVTCQSCGEPLVKIEQPQAELKPNNYLVWSVLVTMFCCIFTGAVALIYAILVDVRWAIGDYAGARAASRNARTWIWISIVAGLLIAICFVLMAVLDSFSGG